MKLNIASNLNLPLETVTQTFAILAKRGVGKTHTAVVMTEEILQVGQQVVVCDPIGVWFGLRSSKDGKSAGLPIVILGGDHADAPLDVASGQVIADLIIDERLSVILDLSRFRKGEQTRFMTDFSERLYHRNREPLHLMMDEADAFAPQRPMKGEERMLGAVEDLVRRGRARGLGITLVTQRSAVLNKNVLSQVEVLVALRTIAPQDREAIDAWINVHGTPEQRKELMASLPSLPIGEAWFWSPGWLGLFQRVKVRDRQTFDSSATPKVGQRVQAPKQMAEVDLAKLRERLSTTIEKVRADDPKALRTEIAALKKQLKDKGTAPAQIDQTLIDRAIAETQQRLKRAYAQAEREYQNRIGELNERLDRMRALLDIPSWTPPTAEISAARLSTDSSQKRAPAHKRTSLDQKSPPSAHKRGQSTHTNSSQPLPKGERAILQALAQYSVEGRTAIQVALLTGYAHNGGGFRNYLGTLRSRGWIAGDSSRLTITDEGLAALGDFDPLPTGDDLINYWLGNLGKCERAILQALTEAYPQEMSVEDLALGTGYEAGGGGFRNALGHLRTLELISGRGSLKASEVFFEGK